jgi:hypothetical protein
MDVIDVVRQGNLKILYNQTEPDMEYFVASAKWSVPLTIGVFFSCR